MKNILIIMILGFLLWGCSNPVETAGGVTSTGNSITALVTDSTGTEIPEALVRLRRSDYLAPKPEGETITPSDGLISYLDTRTDEFGKFQIDSLEKGEYHIEITDEGSRSSLVKISIDTDDSRNDLGTIRLKEQTFIHGNITLTLGSSEAFIQVYGLERLVEPDENGNFTIAVPVDTFSLQLSGGEDINPIEVDQVTAQPDEETSTGSFHLYNADGRFVYPEWKYHSKITVNSGPGGADISENLENFPLLLRLDSSNFDFSKSTIDGADLRFASSDSLTPFDYEIEEWDSAGQSALVWVNIPIVSQGNDIPFFFMFMGMDSASDQSSGPAVFDTVSGFGFVYHMNEDPGSDVIAIKDRTPNHFHGVVNGHMNSDDVVTGAIGSALDFDGVNDYLSPISPEPGFFHDATTQRTLSAWISITPNTEFNPQLIYEEGGQDGFSLAYNPISGSIEFAIETNNSSQEILPSATDVSTFEGQIFVAATFNTGVMKIFINGIEDASFTAANEVVVAHDQQPGIGGTEESILPTGRPFSGTIDEIRGESVARSAAWIFMCYESQKEGADVVVYQGE